MYLFNLIYSFIQIGIHKAKILNIYLYAVEVIVALLLLGRPMYGVLYNIPLSQVQFQIENSFK